MSQSMSLYPILAALRAAEDIPEMGRGRRWRATNEDQGSFLGAFWSSDDLTGLDDLLKAIASYDLATVNAFLAANGFPGLQLDSLAPDSFAIAAVLDMLVEWLQEGTTDTIKRAGSVYPAALVKSGVIILENGGRNFAMLRTKKAADAVVLVPHARVSPGTFGLMNDAINALRQAKAAMPNYDYEGVQFPMVDLTDRPDVSWILNLETTAATGQRAFISQAKAQNRLRMNHKGARAQAAFVGAVTLESVMVERPPLVIDEPFLAIFVREGAGGVPGPVMPVFAAHVTPEDWKDPGDITAA